MKEKNDIEKICLEGTNTLGLQPLYRLLINNTPICLESYQPAPNAKNYDLPECQYCGLIKMYVENTDVLNGWYHQCMIPIIPKKKKKK